MEIQLKEIVSYYFNEILYTVDVSFRLNEDTEDQIRNDQIEIDEIIKFGYNINIENEDILRELYDDADESDFMSKEPEITEDELMEFLNEYYTTYPNKLPYCDLF